MRESGGERGNCEGVLRFAERGCLFPPSGKPAVNCGRSVARREVFSVFFNHASITTMHRKAQYHIIDDLISHTNLASTAARMLSVAVLQPDSTFQGRHNFVSGGVPSFTR